MTAICAKCKRTYQLAEDDSPDRYSCECGSKLYSATDPALQAAIEKEAQTKAQRAGIAVECHTCGSRYNLPAEASGRSYRCRCGLTLPIPLQPQLPPQIKRCPDCGGIVSLHAESCPHCGGPQWYKSSPSNSGSAQPAAFWAAMKRRYILSVGTAGGSDWYVLFFHSSTFSRYVSMP